MLRTNATVYDDEPYSEQFGVESNEDHENLKFMLR